MAHALYTYMGGFALDSSGSNNPILLPGKECMHRTLRSVAVALKLRTGLPQDFQTTLRRVRYLTEVKPIL